MAETKKLLEIRKRIKSRKPEFLQQDYHKKKRVSRKWKRPTGLHSKMRHQFKGYPKRVKQGWRSPEEIRGYHGKGLRPLTVYGLKDLEKVNDEGIIIAGSVGLKKRMAIVEKASELKITILNVKAESVKARADARKKLKEEKQKSKQERKKSLEEAVKKQEKKKEEKKKEETPEKTEEEKKEDEKKMKDDVLIHSQ